MTDYQDKAAANRAPLDWVNFLLADVQGGVGPFLAVFLTSSRHWEAGAAGMALTVGGIATVLAHAPAGELVDVLPAKRTLIALASAVVAVAIISMALWPSFSPVMLAQVANGAADAVFPAAVAAISLGIVGRAHFTARVGRNEAFQPYGQCGHGHRRRHSRLADHAVGCAVDRGGVGAGCAVAAVARACERHRPSGGARC